MKFLIPALTMFALAAPAAAQSIRDCDTFEANARNIYGPYEETIREYANGAIRVIALDVGEPAAAAFHILVSHPLPDEPYPACTLISYQGNLGFGWLDMAATAAAYDPSTGLTVTVPVEIYDGDAIFVQNLSFTVNQALGTVTAVVSSGVAPAPPPAGGSK